MSTMLRNVLAGLVSLATITACQPLQAQTTFDPVFFCGVAGVNSLFVTTQGTTYIFPQGKRLNRIALGSSSLEAGFRYVFPTGWDQFDNVINLGIGPRGGAIATPQFEFATIEYRNDATPVGSGDIYIVIFADAVHRDAFIYYIQQREAAATDADYLYFSTLGAYEFWIGQENESLALYSYYSGMAEYFRDTAADPKHGMYHYWYNIGLAAYYYFEGVGDSESAALAFAYHYQLAVEALYE